MDALSEQQIPYYGLDEHKHATALRQQADISMAMSSAIVTEMLTRNCPEKQVLACLHR